MVEIDPTSANRSKTWIEYPDLSTSQVKVLGRTSGGGLAEQVVARYEFDGLGRIAHAARRKEGTTSEDYQPAEFRHKGFFYNGVGTVWAESHWLDSASTATTPPASVEQTDPDFEIVQDVDPFGRTVFALASDGGQGELTAKDVTVRDLRYGGTEHTFHTQYGYDRWGNVSRIAYPCLRAAGGGCSTVLVDAPVVTSTWDAMGLQRIDGALTGGITRALVDQVTYDPATGMMASWQTPIGLPSKGNAVLHEVVPDGTRPRPAEMKVSGANSGNELLDLTYSYDLLGNVASEHQGADRTTYYYDLLSRLTGAYNSDGSKRTYSYDDFGNLTDITTTAPSSGTGSGGGETVDQVIGVDTATNRLMGSGEQSYLYDGMGNLLRRWQDGEAHWVRRDPEGRILGAWSEKILERYDFAYDANGERIATLEWNARRVANITYTLRDEGGNVLSDIQWSLDDGWSRKRDRFYLGRDEQVRVTYGANGVDRFITTGRDHLGTARAEIYGWDDWRTIDLWPYGEIRRNVPHNATDALLNGVHLFTGHERDWVGTNDNPRKGVDYMHARYYAFNLGRFMSVDPVGGKPGLSQTWNRYAYVRNAPIVKTDPSGEIAPGAGYGNMLMFSSLTHLSPQQRFHMFRAIERTQRQVAWAGVQLAGTVALTAVVPEVVAPRLAALGIRVTASGLRSQAVVGAMAGFFSARGERRFTAGLVGAGLGLIPFSSTSPVANAFSGALGNIGGQVLSPLKGGFSLDLVGQAGLAGALGTIPTGFSAVMMKPAVQRSVLPALNAGIQAAMQHLVNSSWKAQGIDDATAASTVVRCGGSYKFLNNCSQ